MMLISDLQPITEAVVGKLAIGYHRTKNLKGKEDIGTTGFKAGGGKYYGVGIYLTYDFDDQQDDRMKEIYGPLIIRAKVNLDGFLILDPEPAKMVYGITATSPTELLEPQFKRLGLPLSLLPEIVRLYRGSTITSYAAKYAAHKFASKIKGLVFTGDSDGRVIVAYSAAAVVPFSWARVTDLNKTLQMVKWNRYEAPPINQEVAVRMPPQDIAFKYFKRQGFTMLDGRGDAGGYMMGKINGDFITLTIINRQGSLDIMAGVTRIDPHRAKDWNFWMRRMAHRLEYSTSAGEAPLAKIMNTITSEHSLMKNRIETSKTFAESLIRKIAPGVEIQGQFVEGKDYGTDSIDLTAGPISVTIDNPYAKYCHGDLNISIANVTLKLGFNDGTRSSGDSPSLDAAYQMLLTTAGIDGRVWRNIIKQNSLPETLSEQFRKDLMTVFEG